MKVRSVERHPALAGGSLPFFGHALKLMHDPLGFVESLRNYGELVQIAIGPKSAFMVCSPRLLGQLLTAPSDAIVVGGAMWRALEALLGQGLSTSNGALHSRQRRMILQAFRRNRIEGYVQAMSEEARSMSDSFKPMEVIDVSRAMFTLTVRIVTRALLNAEVLVSHADMIGKDLHMVFEGMSRQMFLSALPLSGLLTRSDRRYHQALARLHRVVDEAIYSRRTAPSRSDDLLGLLLAARDEESGQLLSDREIHDQVITMLVGGTDTVAATLSWVFYLLSENLEQESRVHREVDDVVAGQPLGTGQLEALPHTRNVIAESMRLRPAVWILNRHAAVDTVLGEYRIPAGSDLFYSPYAIQRDPTCFDRPLNFDPDRWNPDRSATIPRFAMMPFSAGQRRCPGDQFSLTELLVIVATIASCWRLVPVAATDATSRVGINLQPRKLLMRVEPRGRLVSHL